MEKGEFAMIWLYLEKFFGLPLYMTDLQQRIGEA